MITNAGIFMSWKKNTITVFFFFFSVMGLICIKCLLMLNRKKEYITHYTTDFIIALRGFKRKKDQTFRLPVLVSVGMDLCCFQLQR